MTLSRASSPPTVAVIGPLTCGLGDGCRGAGLRHLLETLIEALETAGFRVSSAHRSEDWGSLTELFSADAIARRDFGWLDGCSAVIAVLSTSEQAMFRSDGTFLELGYAIASRKPILFVGDLDAYPSLMVQGLPASCVGGRIVPPSMALHEPRAVLAALEDILPTGSPNRLLEAAG